MANGEVKNTDLFEKDLLKPTIEEFKVLIKLVGDLKAEVVQLAKVNKKLSQSKGSDTSKTKNIKEISKAEEEAIKLAKEKLKLDKEQKKLQEQLIKAQDDEVKGKIRLQKANKEQKDELKDLLVLENKQAGTLEKLAASSRKLRREREKLNLDTEKGRKRLQQINKELDKNNSKIKKNSDALKKQKLNVGNYTSSIKEAAQSSGLFGGVLSKLTAIQGTLQALRKKTIVTEKISINNTYKQIAASKSLTRSKKAQLIAQKALNTAVKASLVGIALLAAGGLVATFTRTQKRVDQLSDAMSSMGAIVDIVIDRFSQIGEGIILMFNNSLNTFSKFRLKILIGATKLKLEIQEALHFEVPETRFADAFEFGTAKEKIKGTNDELAKLNTELKGIEDTASGLDLITSAFDDLGAEIQEEIKLAAKFNSLRRELNREQKIFSIHLNDEISANKKLQLIVRDKIIDDNKRLEALEKIKKSETELSEAKIEFAKRDLRLSLDSEKSFANLSAERKKFIQDLRDGSITSDEAIAKAEQFTLSSSAGEEALFNIIEKINNLKKEEIEFDQILIKLTKQKSGLQKEIGAKVSKGIIVVAQNELKLAKDLTRTQEERHKNLIMFQDESIRGYKVQLDANIITLEEFNARRLQAELIYQEELKKMQLSKDNAEFQLEEFRREQAIKSEKDLEQRIQNELSLVNFRTEKLLENETLLEDEITLIKEKAEAERNAIVKKGDEDRLAQQKDADAKQLEQTQETAEQVNEVLDQIQTRQRERFDERLSKIDKEVEASKEREDDLKEIAREGIVDSSENLAFEQRKQAELQQEKEKQLKKQQRTELGFAALKTYTAKVSAGDETPVLSTLQDITLLFSALKSLPTFFGGSDRLGDDLNPSLNTGQDDYIIRADKDEMIVDPEKANEMRSMGYNTRTKILDGLKLAEKLKRGELTGNSVDNYIVGPGYQSNEAIINKLDSVEKAINSKPVYLGRDYDATERAIIDQYQEGNRRINNHKKLGAIWE